MDEKTIRLNEMDKLKEHLDRHGVTNMFMHGYVEERRRVIELEHPDAPAPTAEAPAEAVNAQAGQAGDTEGEQEDKKQVVQ